MQQKMYTNHLVGSVLLCDKQSNHSQQFKTSCRNAVIYMVLATEGLLKKMSSAFVDIAVTASISLTNYVINNHYNEYNKQYTPVLKTVQNKPVRVV